MIESGIDATGDFPGVGAIEGVVQPGEFAHRAIGVIEFDAMTGGVVAREQQSCVAQSGGNHVEGAALDVVGNFLFEAGDDDASLSNDFAAIGQERAVEQLHDGALAGAIPAQEADAAFAALDREIGVIEEGRASEGDRNFLRGPAMPSGARVRVFAGVHIWAGRLARGQGGGVAPHPRGIRLSVGVGLSWI